MWWYLKSHNETNKCTYVRCVYHLSFVHRHVIRIRYPDDDRDRDVYLFMNELTSVILFNDQLDAQLFFCICLFQFSTCFELSSAHHQEIQLYQYDIWYMSFYVGDRLVCRADGHLHRMT